MNNEKKTNTARNFCFTIYPDSMPKNAIAMLLDEKLDIIISPLHQPDTDSSLEDYHPKPHHHVMVSYSGRRITDNVTEHFQPKYHGTRAFIVGDRNSYTRYMVHLDNPEKEQFEIRELMANYDYRPYITKEVYIMDILKEIKNRRIRDFTILVDTLVDEDRFAELEKISSKATFFLKYFERYNNGKNK